ncbi:MAG: hypothetical protein CMD72_02320 [Gammaproteobacteria bacterium]|jgi:cell division protein FtsL|nr:hypothetical protein [Gammaproteobacteria bacterium]|tara:strand:+ start:256 stop:528 length:273 start_codon:yes stop_codon:yes gene_type:complete
MSNLKIYIISFLIVSNISLSFGIVWVEHLTRSQFRDLQLYSEEKSDLKNEWRKSRIDEGRYASLIRIEQKAQTLLNMSLPKKKVLININD